MSKHVFDQAIALTATGEGTYSGATSPAYANMIGPYGGITAATVLHGVMQHPALLGEPLNKVSFRRRIDEMDLLEPIEGERTGGAHRPAQLWRLKDRRPGALTLTDRLLGPAVLAP